MDFETIEKELETLGIHLEEAKESAKRLEKLFGHDAANCGPRIGAYLVGTLESFLDNQHQAGSIPDIEDGIRELKDQE